MRFGNRKNLFLPHPNVDPVTMKDWLKQQYYRYKDFFPADLWSILILLIILVLGLIFVL